MFPRHTRYQGAIIRDHYLLLIKERENATGRSFWFFPGGGMEEGETAEECVRREMKEETGLDVEVKSLLLDGPELNKESPYQRHLTYLCGLLSSDAKPGPDPEKKEEGHFTIVDLAWFDLTNEANWDLLAVSDYRTYYFLQLVRKKLDYSEE